MPPKDNGNINWNRILTAVLIVVIGGAAASVWDSSRVHAELTGVNNSQSLEIANVQKDVAEKADKVLMELKFETNDKEHEALHEVIRDLKSDIKVMRQEGAAHKDAIIKAIRAAK